VAGVRRYWVVPDEVARALDKNAVLPLRPVRTDKNEATRGDKSFEEHPLIAKTRLVCPGYADPQALEKLLATDAPALTPEGTALIYAEAAGANWRLEQGVVDSAFLNGRCLSEDRLVYFRVPKGGLPEVAEFGWPALPPGTVLKAKKAGYGLKDAPLQWYLAHAGQIMDLPGARRSKLDPALFLFENKHGVVDGLISVHVDDDLITGSERFFTEVIPELKKTFCYGKWVCANNPGESFTHCGKHVLRGNDGRVIASQRDYALSLEHIYVERKRSKIQTQTATMKERVDLRSGCGKVS
jgi:hypothetical protein